jgi:hypothetical protein
MSREIADEGRTAMWLCQTAKLVSLYYFYMCVRASVCVCVPTTVENVSVCVCDKHK